MDRVAYVSSIHMRPIIEADGAVRLRPYTTPEIDTWANEVVNVAGMRWAAEIDVPPMLWFLFPPRSDDRCTMQGMINISPFIRTGRISDMVAALPKTLQEMRAFAMLRVEWLRVRNDQAMRATFETYQRAWTKLYRLSKEPPHTELIESHEGSKNPDPRFERWLKNDAIN